MSWVTIIWAMTASACLTLALVHVLVWWQQRQAQANLIFALTAVATAILGGCELWMMRAKTPLEFSLAVRWIHAPAWVLVVSLVGFVRLYLRAGRLWLAWTVCGVRTLSLILNFVSTPNLNYREIIALRHVPFLGDTVVVAEGIPNPWMVIGQLSLLLLVLFVADAAITVWRRGDRRQALLVGSSMIFFVAAATGQVILTLWGIIHVPITSSLFFVPIVAAMGHELSQDVFRAARLSDDLRKSQQRMALATDRFRLVVEASPNGIVLVQEQGQIVLVNARAEKLFGYRREELIGQSIERLVPERFRGKHPVYRASFHAAPAARPMGAGLELFARRKDGTEFPVEIGVSPIQSPEETLVLGVIVDISGRKQAEAEARRHREELAHLSRVAIMGEIAGSLAHELNQPLTGIVNNASAGRRFIAKGRGDLPRLDSLFEAVVADGRRAGEIIRAIRSMVRKSEEVRGAVNLNDVIASVLRFVHSDALGRQCALVTEPDPMLPLVEGDSVQLQQVLLNLIVNAFEAMHEIPAAERRVIIRSERESADRVRVSVRDFGTGLPADEPERIFERFFSTKREGMGMGLAIARSIITSHGGELSAVNAQESGACVYFSLPVIAGD